MRLGNKNNKEDNKKIKTLLNLEELVHEQESFQIVWLDYCLKFRLIKNNQKWL